MCARHKTRLKGASNSSISHYMACLHTSLSLHVVCVCVRVCVHVFESMHLATFSNCMSLDSRFIMRFDWSCFFALARSPLRTNRQIDRHIICNSLDETHGQTHRKTDVA